MTGVVPQASQIASQTSRHRAGSTQEQRHHERHNAAAAKNAVCLHSAAGLKYKRADTSEPSQPISFKLIPSPLPWLF